MNNTTRLMDYLDGNLNANENKAFEKELQTNDNLKELLGLHKEVDTFIKDTDLNEFRDILTDTYTDFSDNKKKSNLKFNPVRHLSNHVRLIAASVTILFLVASGLYIYSKYSENHQLTANEVFELYYKPYDADFIMRSPDTAEATNFSQATRAYDAGNYERALQLFENELETSEPSEFVKFFGGICHLELDHTDKAIEYFGLVASNTGNLFYVHAKWYLGLSLIKYGDTQTARQVLHELSEISDFYKDNCLSLLEHI